MSMILSRTMVQNFLRDRRARLAPAYIVPHRPQRHRQQAQERAGAPTLLLVGTVAALYVALRIGLTYVAL